MSLSINNRSQQPSASVGKLGPSQPMSGSTSAAPPPARPHQISPTIHHHLQQQQQRHQVSSHLQHLRQQLHIVPSPSQNLPSSPASVVPPSAQSNTRHQPQVHGRHVSQHLSSSLGHQLDPRHHQRIAPNSNQQQLPQLSRSTSTIDNQNQPIASHQPAKVISPSVAEPRNASSSIPTNMFNKVINQLLINMNRCSLRSTITINHLSHIC